MRSLRDRLHRELENKLDYKLHTYLFCNACIDEIIFDKLYIHIFHTLNSISYIL